MPPHAELVRRRLAYFAREMHYKCAERWGKAISAVQLPSQVAQEVLSRSWLVQRQYKKCKQFLVSLGCAVQAAAERQDGLPGTPSADHAGQEQVRGCLKPTNKLQ